MQNRIAIMLIFMVATLCCCQNSRVTQQLDVAEAIMEERPDSALEILQQVDGSTLHGEPLARHALLLSQAYDKNYIDLTSDSLISIATTYYNNHGDKHRKLLANYYSVSISMNRREFDKAISKAFDVEKLAEDLKDSRILAQIRAQIARAYLLTFNQEGAKEYFEKALVIARQLNHTQWIGTAYINLSNLALQMKDYPLAIAYTDSAQCYIPEDTDIAEYKLLALIGAHNYREADSLFTHHIQNPTVQARAYKQLADFQLGKGSHVKDSLSSLLSQANHFDSIEIAYIGSHINRVSGDYEQALVCTEALLEEANNILIDLSSHSLYRIELEHEKLKQIETENHIRNQRLSLVFAGIVILLIIIFGVVYFRLVAKRHDEEIAQTRNEVLLISSEFAEMQNNLKQEIRTGQIAAQELFMSKYAWIEELGNIFIDAETSKASTNRAMRDLKKRLDAVKTQEFTEHLIEVINKYCNNLIERVKTECPSITESEGTILALICANLSPRIISFILNIKPQSIYNAKHSIKRKIEQNSPSLLSELPL